MSWKLRDFGGADASPTLSQVLSWLEALIGQEEEKPMSHTGPLARRLERAEEAKEILQEIVDSQ